jgi:hypothetical protein
MKIKAGLCGALLVLSTATAYGLGMQDGQAESPVPATPASATVRTFTMPPDERIRANVAKAGLDPDSDNGRVLVQWLIRIAADPAYQAKLLALPRGGSPFGNMQLSPEDRLNVLRLMSDLASSSPNDCGAFMMQEKSGDLFAMAKTLSTRGLQDFIGVMDILAKPRSVQSGTDGNYTVAELLDADAHFDASDSPASSALKSASTPCEVMRLIYVPIAALPQPVQQRATYELFKAFGGGEMASGSVLDDPSAYLDDMFDERRLPESIRSLLPADGSRPLPFSRVIVDGEWVNKTTPADSAPFTDTYINRRNNGVIAEFDNSPDSSGKTIWSDFTLTYGYADLLSQTVEGRSDVTMLAALKDGAAIAAANQPLVERKRIDLPLPQPKRDGQTSRSCEVGKTIPASTIFGSLTGDAIETVCTEVRKDGVATHVRSVWLADYGIVIARTIEDQDGRTDVVVKNVTIVKP